MGKDISAWVNGIVMKKLEKVMKTCWIIAIYANINTNKRYWSNEVIIIVACMGTAFFSQRPILPSRSHHPSTPAQQQDPQFQSLLILPLKLQDKQHNIVILRNILFLYEFDVTWNTMKVYFNPEFSTQLERLYYNNSIMDLEEVLHGYDHPL